MDFFAPLAKAFNVLRDFFYRPYSNVAFDFYGSYGGGCAGNGLVFGALRPCLERHKLLSCTQTDKGITRHFFVCVKFAFRESASISTRD